MRPKIVYWSTLLLGGLLALGLFASSSLAAPARAITVDVSIVEPSADQSTWGYDPSSVTIHVGDTVRWTNNGTHQHTVSSDNGTFELVLNPGESKSITFNQVGTKGYHDNIYPSMRRGQVIVQAGPAPTSTRRPTVAPTRTKTSSPTLTNTVVPTEQPTATVELSPTPSPTLSPSPAPTVAVTETQLPTSVPPTETPQVETSASESVDRTTRLVQVGAASLGLVVVLLILGRRRRRR